jgi:hypothetical protein
LVSTAPLVFVGNTRFHCIVLGSLYIGKIPPFPSVGNNVKSGKINKTKTGKKKEKETGYQGEREKGKVAEV